MKSRTIVLLSLTLSCWSISCNQRIQCVDRQVTSLVVQTIRNNTVKLIESISADKDSSSKMLREWVDYRVELADIRTVKVEEGQGKCQCEANLNVSWGT